MKNAAFTTTLILLVASSTLASSALTQTALTLPSAVNKALSSGPDVSSARNTYAKALANLKAKQLDPTTLGSDLLSAQQGASSNLAALNNAKLSTVQTVLSQYLSLLEGQQTLALNAAQVSLDGRNLTIVQAKLAAKSATALEVAQKQNTLSTSRQTLVNTRAQLPVLSAGLAKTLGLPTTGVLQVSALPATPGVSATLEALSSGLERRLPGLISASQAVDSAALQVKLADNDYTPRRTLEDAQIALQNARTALESERKNAGTNLRDSLRAHQDALEQVKLAGQSLSNGQKTLAQTQARFKLGTAAQVEVQTAQVATLSSQLALTKAQDNVWKASATLSVASGLDLTNLVEGLK